MVEVLANATMEIIVQFINISNQCVAHLKGTQCYRSIMSQLNNSINRGYFVLYCLSGPLTSNLSNILFKGAIKFTY